MHRAGLIPIGRGDTYAEGFMVIDAEGNEARPCEGRLSQCESGLSPEFATVAEYIGTALRRQLTGMGLPPVAPFA